MTDAAATSTNGHSQRPGPVAQAERPDVPLRALFDSTPINVAYCDPQLTIRYANRKAMEALAALASAVEAEAVLGEPLDMLHAFSPAERRSLRAGKDVYVQAKVGAEAMSIQAVPVRGPGGEVQGISVTWHEVTGKLEAEGALRAIDKAMAVIEFEMDGTVRTANAGFLGALGYTLDEIKGHHHRMFVEPAFAASPEYAQFWDSLRTRPVPGRGVQAHRQGRQGGLDPGFLQPHPRPGGTPHKVVKFATDTTAQKLRNADYEGQLKAIDKVMATIEFEIDGTVLDGQRELSRTRSATRSTRSRAATTACSSSRLRGEPRVRRFLGPPSSRRSTQTAEYKRIGKGGKDVWIQASYNPILDSDGKPFKVVKFATDVTAQKLKNADGDGQLAAIDKIDGHHRVRNRRDGHRRQLQLLAAHGVSQGRGQGPASPDVRRGAYAASQSTATSGQNLRRGEFQTTSSSASARAARWSGSRPRTTRSSI